MFCENKFCFNNVLGLCEKAGVEIDVTGHCKSCLCIDITDDELMTIKARQFDEIMKDVMEKALVCEDGADEHF